MPVPMLKSLAKKYSITLATAERLWAKAKKAAKAQNKADDYEYITGTFKAMVANHKKSKKGN